MHDTFRETPTRIDSPDGAAWGVVCLPTDAEPAAAARSAVTAESMPALPSGEEGPLRRDDGVVDRRALGWELREAGWSNKRIARELGVHPSTVGRWFAVAHLTDTTDTADEREEKTP